MDFSELIINSRPFNTKMSIFMKLIVMNQADTLAVSANPTNSVSNDEAISIAREYSIALNQAESVFNVFPPLIDFTAHLWAKIISGRITSQFSIQKDEFNLTRTGLFFINIEQSKMDQLSKKHGVHFDDLIDLNLFAYSKIFDDLNFEVKQKDHTFHLDPTYQSSLIEILISCLNYSIQTFETAILNKSALVNNYH
jgi:hypothetical protein